MEQLDQEIRRMIDAAVSAAPEGPRFEEIVRCERSLDSKRRLRGRSAAVSMVVAACLATVAFLAVGRADQGSVTVDATVGQNTPTTRLGIDTTTGAAAPATSLPSGIVGAPRARASTPSQTVELRTECWTVGEHGRCSTVRSGTGDVELRTASGQSVTLSFDRPEQPQSVSARVTGESSSTTITLEAKNPTAMLLERGPGTYRIEITAGWTDGTSIHRLILAIM